MNECCAGDFEKTEKDFFKELEEQTQEIMNKECCDEDGKESKKSGGKGNWLVALAEAMGSVAGKFASDMVESANKISNINGADAEELQAIMGGKDNFKMPEKAEGETDGQALDKAQAKAMSTVQAKMQSQAQMFKMVSEATSTAIKSIGEGMSSMARKQ